MMRFKKMMAVLLAAALALTMLTACGGGGGSSSGANQKMTDEINKSLVDDGYITVRYDAKLDAKANENVKLYDADAKRLNKLLKEQDRQMTKVVLKKGDNKIEELTAEIEKMIRFVDASKTVSIGYATKTEKASADETGIYILIEVQDTQPEN